MTLTVAKSRRLYAPNRAATFSQTVKLDRLMLLCEPAADWVSVLAPDQPWQEAYAIVELHSRALLSQLDDGMVLSTTQVVDWLWPKRFRVLGDVDQAAAHRRLYKSLNALQRHDLMDCCTLGTPRKIYGRVSTPVLWHKPDPVKTARISTDRRYSTAAVETMKVSAYQLVGDAALIVLAGEPGFRGSIDERLGQLTQIVLDARKILEGGA